MRSKPWWCNWRTTTSSTGRSPIGISGLGRTAGYGRRRMPSPPARTTARVTEGGLPAVSPFSVVGPGPRGLELGATALGLQQSVSASWTGRPEGVGMQSSAQPTRVLVVAHRTAATLALVDAVRQRAQQGPATFTLLVPDPAHGLHRVVDPEDVDSSEGHDTLELGIPRLQEAAGSEFDGMLGVAEPLAAIQDAVNIHGFDEIIISTLPKRVSRWLKLDLPHKAAGLGLPVTVVTAQGTEKLAGHA